MNDASKTPGMIMGIATELFGSNGFHGTSVKQLATAANMAQGLLYSHFKNKSGLLQDIFTHRSGQLVEELTSKRKKGKLKSSEEYVEDVFNCIETHRDFWKLYHNIRIEVSLQDLWKEQIETIYAKIAKDLKKINAKEKGEPIDAHMLMLLLNGLFAQKFIEPSFSMKAAKKELMKKVFNLPAKAKKKK